MLNNQLRLQGNAMFAMVGMTVGRGSSTSGWTRCSSSRFDMGVAGAAIATMISQMIAFVLLFLGTRRGDNLRIHLKRFSPTVELPGHPARRAARAVPPEHRQHLHHLAQHRRRAVWAIRWSPRSPIVFRIMMFVQMIVIGLGQGFQPICGFNYGSGATTACGKPTGFR